MWLFFLSQNTPFSLFKHCLGCLFTHSQPPFPFFQWVIPWMEKPTQVWWVCCFGKHLMMGVWMVLMSHNEPLHNHNTHHVCFPAFHSCAFHSHPPHTNDVHVIVSPMVCSVIQPMSCAVHISPSQSHPHSCLYPITEHSKPVSTHIPSLITIPMETLVWEKPTSAFRLCWTWNCSSRQWERNHKSKCLRRRILFW